MSYPRAEKEAAAVRRDLAWRLARALPVVMALAVLARSAVLDLAEAWADQGPAQVKSAGKLRAPVEAALEVIATDPVLQEIISQDFRAARRAPNGSQSQTATLTVTMTQRVMAPGMSLTDVAPGDPNAIALLKQLGVAPVPFNDAGGAPSTKGQPGAQSPRQASDIQSYVQQGTAQEPSQGGTGPMPFMPAMPFGAMPYGAMPYGGMPLGNAMPMGPQTPFTPQTYGPPLPYGQNYPSNPSSPSNRELSRIYDTILIARARIDPGAGELTVVAVSNPGENLRDLKEMVAEEVVNAVLH